MFNLFGRNYGKSLKEIMDELNEMMGETLNYDNHFVGKKSSNEDTKEESGTSEDGEWYRTTYTSPNGTVYTITTTYFGTPIGKSNKKSKDILSSLKRELEECVEKQDFEKAAQLRDQIKKIETNKEEISKLEDELKTAIEKQEFEEAIKLRDKIKELKS